MKFQPLNQLILDTWRPCLPGDGPCPAPASSAALKMPLSLNISSSISVGYATADCCSRHRMMPPQITEVYCSQISVNMDRYDKWEEWEYEDRDHKEL